MTLLLHRRGFGIALGDDDPPQIGAVLAGYVLPDGLALVIAEIDFAFAVGGREEYPPAVFRHLHIIEMRPTARMDADGGSQVHVGGVRALRAHVRPPLEELGLPVLESTLQHFVAAEVDI